MAMPHYDMVCQELHLTKRYDARCADPLVDNAIQPRAVCSGDRAVRRPPIVAFHRVCAMGFLSGAHLA
jgi:hypothetical protein